MASVSLCIVMFQLVVLVFQLAAVMWVLTYVGAVFNGVTILILGEADSDLNPVSCSQI